MSVPAIGFLSTRHGIGTTTLVYNLGWMYASLGWRVLMADLDPQADLTLACREFIRIPVAGWRDTVWTALQCHGDEPVRYWPLAERLFLLAGHPQLAGEEDALAEAWRDSVAGSAEGWAKTTGLSRVVREVASACRAQLVLADVPPHLGAVSRAALTGCDHVVLTVATDAASNEGLRAVKRTLARWRAAWRDAPPTAATGGVRDAGYVILRHGPPPALVHDEPLTYALAEDLPQEQVEHLLAEHRSPPNCLGVVKPYPALVELAHEARKPMFALQAADGAIGAHAQLVAEAYRNFREIAENIAQRCGLSRPASE